MIYLSAYNPDWPTIYEKEKQLLIKAIGQHINDIQHIGSTSIKAISAKPVIDIMIGVYNLADIDKSIIKKIKNLNYGYIKKYEVDMPYRRFFQKATQAGIRTHHIHLVEKNTDFWIKHLLFRDYLRAYPDEAKRYENLKKALAQEFTDTNEYALAKTDFCNEIHEKAMQEKKEIIGNDYSKA